MCSALPAVCGGLPVCSLCQGGPTEKGAGPRHLQARLLAAGGGRGQQAQLESGVLRVPQSRAVPWSVIPAVREILNFLVAPQKWRKPGEIS